MFTATVTVIPDARYQVLGTVIGEMKTLVKEIDPEAALKSLEQQAAKMGATGVIGIQIITMTRPTVVGQQNLMWAIGTAIKFL